MVVVVLGQPSPGIYGGGGAALAQPGYLWGVVVLGQPSPRIYGWHLRLAFKICVYGREFVAGIYGGHLRAGIQAMHL